MPGDIRFIDRFGLLSSLIEKEICSNEHGCDCDRLHKV